MAVALVILLASGCARTVLVDPPTPGPAAAQACRAFIAALPHGLSTVGAQRRVTPPSDLTAAYGDPPVAVRCGVVDPAALAPASQLVSVDGIDWFPEELTGGWLMTTIDRVANVEITVPSAHEPAPSVASDLAPTIARTIPHR